MFDQLFKIFEKHDNKEIDLQLLTLCKSPFLKTGTIVAFFGLGNMADVMF